LELLKIKSRCDKLLNVINNPTKNDGIVVIVRLEFAEFLKKLAEM